MIKQEKTERKAHNPNERAVYSALVQEQRGDLFKVTSAGTVVEYTDRYADATAAFKNATKPKSMFKLVAGTRVAIKLAEEII